MRIEAIYLHPVRLPFVGDFSHSLKKGHSAVNIVVEVVADGGTLRGYGEGAPRSYVTGESIDSAIRDIRGFTNLKRFPWDLDEMDAIRFLVAHISNGGGRNAAICALETALIDLLGKEAGKPALDYFSSSFKTNHVWYGAAIPLTGAARTTEISRFIKNRLRINRIKLKLNDNRLRNQAALKALRDVFKKNVDLKVDVNCVWDHDLAMTHLDLIRDYQVRVVEQPMMPNRPEIAEFAARLEEMKVLLMADESACTLEDIEKLLAESHYNMINIRLSKCGGIFNSLRIIQYLREKKVPFQIACQLGESGILSAAGRLIGLLCRDAVYNDGSYDEFLLKENVTTKNVSFDPGGKAGPLSAPGLGVTVSKRSLKRLSAGFRTVEIKRP